VKPPPGSRSGLKIRWDFQKAPDIIVLKAGTTGVVIEICAKYPGGPPLMEVADIREVP
jgi:hypothetical protein